MRRLWDSGFQNIVIQETGNEAWGAYQGPFSSMLRMGTSSYDAGMVNFKQQIRDWPGVILFVDNDCFLSSADGTRQYIQDFIDGGYDFACHHVSADHYKEYNFVGSIALVAEQTFNPVDAYPGFVPSGRHWFPL